MQKIHQILVAGAVGLAGGFLMMNVAGAQEAPATDTPAVEAPADDVPADPMPGDRDGRDCPEKGGGGGGGGGESSDSTTSSSDAGATQV